MPSSVLSIYESTNPSLAGNDALVSSHNEHLIKSAIKQVTSSIKEGRGKHALYVGAGGHGKTLLLSLITERINNSPALSHSALVLRFPEDSSKILNYAGFLLGLCSLLRHSKRGLGEWDKLYNACEQEQDDKVIINKIQVALKKNYEEHKVSLVIMLENFDELLRKQMRSDADRKALSSFFTKEKGNILISSSRGELDPDHEKLFSTHLETYELPAFDFNQSLASVTQSLAIIDQNFPDLAANVYAIHKIVGGNPRRLALATEILAQQEQINLPSLLLALLDRTSPGYNAQLQSLGAQERAALVTIASMRDELKTPSAITAKMRMGKEQVSVLLRRLYNSQYLDRVANPETKDQRSAVYVLRDGLFDIWLAVRYVPEATENFSKLIEHLNDSYPPNSEEKEKIELWKNFRIGGLETGTAPAAMYIKPPKKASKKVVKATKKPVYEELPTSLL